MMPLLAAHPNLSPRSFTFPVVGEDERANGRGPVGAVLPLPMRTLHREPAVAVSVFAQPAPADDSGDDPGLGGADNVVEISVQAYAEGFARGRAEGETTARQEGRIAVGHLMAVTRGVGEHRAEIASDLEAAVVELALLVAERVLHAEVSVASAQLATRLAAAGLARLGQCERLLVRVHPEDHQSVSALPALVDAKVTFVADARLSRGDAVVESEVGRVDGRLCAMLDEARACLVAPDSETSP